MKEENKFFDYTLEPGRKLIDRNILNDGKPLISIITAYYNAKEYIEQTANSIFNQTFPYWEWIIVNDGSTEEGNTEILEKLAKKDSRVKIYHKENEGLPKTRDYALSKSNCDLVYIVDADDLIDTTMLEACYWAITTNKDITWVYSDSVGFGSKQYLWKVFFNTIKEKKKNLLCVSSLINKQKIIEAGGYSKAQRGVYEDWHLWLRFLAKGYKPAKLGFYGLWYRNKENSGVLNSINNDKKKKKSAMKVINSLADKVKYKVGALQFPTTIESDYDSYPTEFEWDRKSINIKGEKKRILFILPWTVTGGADIFNLNLIKGLKGKGYEITVATTEHHDYMLRQQFEKNVDEYFDLTSFLKRKDWAGFLHYIIKSRNIDLVFQSNSFYGYYSIPWLKCKFPEIPFVDYLHAEDWSWRDGSYPRDSIAISKYLDRTYTCTKFLKELMYNKMNKKVENTEVVYIGTDPERFNPSIKYSDEEKLLKKYSGKKIILFPCRIEYLKRPIFVIKLMNELCKRRKDIICIFVGDGPARETTLSYVKEYGLEENVKFTGMVKDPRVYFKIADVTLICSLVEGLTLTAYESLSMSVPVVSSDVGGQRELIDDSCGKIIKTYQNIEKDLHNFDYSKQELNEYVDAILEIFDNKDIDKMKATCREKIINEFSFDKMVENLSSDFGKLINEGTKVGKDITNNIEIAERYLILFNEANKKYYFNPDDNKVVNKSQKVKNFLWQFLLWRGFIKLCQKAGIIRLIKKVKRKLNKSEKSYNDDHGEEEN